jgi:hypothetical protein
VPFLVERIVMGADAVSDDSIPIRLHGFAKYRVRQFDLGDPGFEALYRELTVQPAILKPVLGARVALGTKSPALTQVAAPLPEKPARRLPLVLAGRRSRRGDKAHRRMRPWPPPRGARRRRGGLSALYASAG